MSSLPKYCEEFILERRFLLGVSERTVDWYEQAFRQLGKYCPEEVTEAGLKACIIGMRQTAKPISVNSRIRVFKTYLNWSKSDIKLGYLKTEQKEIQIFKPEDIRKLVGFRATTTNDRRVKLLCLLLLDAGLRVEEALALQVSKVDLDNLILLVKGKGDKERVVPISYELRKALHIWCREKKASSFDYLFSTHTRTRLSRRNALRDFKNLCKKAGVIPPPRAIHALRHTFAVNYLRNGGNLFYLARILGHSKVTTTQVYLNAVSSDDLSAVHQQRSILARM